MLRDESLLAPVHFYAEKEMPIGKKVASSEVGSRDFGLLSHVLIKSRRRGNFFQGLLMYLRHFFMFARSVVSEASALEEKIVVLESKKI